jgi:hypothetical protein
MSAPFAYQKFATTLSHEVLPVLRKLVAEMPNEHKEELLSVAKIATVAFLKLLEEEDKPSPIKPTPCKPPPPSFLNPQAMPTPSTFMNPQALPSSAKKRLRQEDCSFSVRDILIVFQFKKPTLTRYVSTVSAIVS